MSRYDRRIPCRALIVLLFASAASAQESLPRLGYAYPAGGRQGTAFRITLGGQYLNLSDIRSIHVSGSGVEARVVQGIKPLVESDVRALREKLMQLTRGEKLVQLMRGPKDAPELKEIATIQRTLVRYMSAQSRRQTHPAISETLEVAVAIRADAEPGQREMRVETSRGMSNPLTFCVGQLPEFREQEPELVLGVQEYDAPLRFPPPVTTDITLPAVANGQIIPRDPDIVRYGPDRFTPGDADRYRFTARKGQRLVIAASARELIPYLADAVPGWFQATLTLYNAQGKELAYDDDYRFHPDPVLFFTVPEDGQYIVEIKDAIYRGRPDFVYRISIGELPFITGIFPLGGPAGRQTTVELNGGHLPAEKLTFDATDKPPGVYPLSVRKGGLISNTVSIAVDNLPECFEREPNDALPTAQPVTLPVIVNGRIDRPGDWDLFRFHGRAGQRIVAEVQARRLDSPLDSVLELTDGAAKRLALNDDHEDKADALHTHSADSLIEFTLPADGTYFLRLGDAQHQGGPEYAYRLRISPPRPDFALRVVPSCIHAVSWRLTPITVYALRKDGFFGEIALNFKDRPDGLAIGGGVIPEGQDRVRITLAIAPWLPWEPRPLCLEGRATIDRREVVHAAVPADDRMQAFAYKHLVPAKDLTLLRGDRPRSTQAGARWASRADPTKTPFPGRRDFYVPLSLVDEHPVRIPAGGSAEVQVRTPAFGSRFPTHVELSDPPEGITVEKVSPAASGLALVLRCDAAKTKPGLKGNLIANIYQERSETTKDGKKREFRSFMGPLPAIPFEVVAQGAPR